MFVQEGENRSIRMSLKISYALVLRKLEISSVLLTNISVHRAVLLARGTMAHSSSLELNRVA